MNENGEMFAEHKLVIGGNVFPNKTVHKATWVSRVTEKQMHVI